jgi:rhomboid protease GluP
MDLKSILETPGAWAIAAVNVVYFLIAQFQGDTTKPETLIRFGALDRGRIWKEGESWRLVTACFMHVGWLHLLWNTYAMFGWCEHVEEELGSVRFLLAYLMTGIGASAVSVLGHRAVSAGASGAGFGMIGVALMIAYRKLGDWDAFFADPYVLSILKTAGIWFLLGIFVIRQMDNWAHGGGFLFGLLGGYALTFTQGDGGQLRIPVLIVVIALWLGVVWASLHPRFARKPRDPDPESPLP